MFNIYCETYGFKYIKTLNVYYLFKKYDLTIAFFIIKNEF
jgi:hypothetical protein